MAGLILDTGHLDQDLLGPVGIATGNLGSVTSTATARVDNLVTASAALGGSTSSASATVKISVSANSVLGALVAEANTIPTPPAPEVVVSAPSGMPNFVQPYFPKVVEVEKKIVVVSAIALANVASFNANALARIDFSIIADDDEVLLLI